MARITRSLGTPRERYDAALRQFSLDTKPRFLEPIGLGEGFGLVPTAMAPKRVVDLDPRTHEQTTLPQRNREVFNLSGLLNTKD